jgi:acyl-CoA thioesterase FadM
VPNIKPTHTHIFFPGVCLTRDIDTMLNHMNNARYFRELDLARIDFYLRTRLYDEVRKNRGQIVLANANIRFRKFIPVFGRFKISTKVLFWNDDALFLEHKFVGGNGVIHAVLLCQQKFIKCSGETVMNALLGRGDPVLTKPEMPLEVSNGATNERI